MTDTLKYTLVGITCLAGALLVSFLSVRLVTLPVWEGVGLADRQSAQTSASAFGTIALGAGVAIFVWVLPLVFETKDWSAIWGRRKLSGDLQKRVGEEAINATFGSEAELLEKNNSIFWKAGKGSGWSVNWQNDVKTVSGMLNATDHLVKSDLRKAILDLIGSYREIINGLRLYPDVALGKYKEDAFGFYSKNARFCDAVLAYLGEQECLRIADRLLWLAFFLLLYSGVLAMLALSPDPYMICRLVGGYSPNKITSACDNVYSVSTLSLIVVIYVLIVGGLIVAIRKMWDSRGTRYDPREVSFMDQVAKEFHRT